MVKKKRQSKRQSLHQQYKLKRLVTEHHRKARREARKNPTKTKLKKDPGIPNLYPYKEELLQKIENQRIRLENEQDRQKLQRLALQKQKRQESASMKPQSIQSLAADAAKRTKAFDKKSVEEQEREIRAQLYDLKDGSKRAYFREFKKIVESADVILEVLDARDPLGCRCPDVEQKILAKHPNKRIILVLNKIDLIPKENVEAWLKYLRNEYPTIAFKCSTQDQRKNLGRSGVSTDMASNKLLDTSECLGADTLIQLLKNYSRNMNLKTSINVGIIGYPNVGKSSLINSLKRAKAVGVGATPGFTKTVQEIQLDKNIKLLDSPGIVFGSNNSSDSDIVLRNCVRVEKIADPIAPVETIVNRCKKDQLLQIYQIENFSTIQEFLIHIAQKRGKLKKGGAPNLGAAAKTVLQDWNGGKIPFFTIPPELKNVHLGAAIVTEYSKIFDVDEVFKNEQSAVIANLPANNSAAHMMMESRGVSAADAKIMSDDVEEDDESDDEDAEMDEDDDEEEEDDVEEEEEEDAMEDVEETPAPVARKTSSAAPAVATTSTATTSAKNRQQQKLRDEEDELNPQSNKTIKKNLKKQKKLSKKGKTLSNNAMDDDEDDDYTFDDFVKEQKGKGSKKGGSDSYDFSTDFIGGNDDDSDVDLDDI